MNTAVINPGNKIAVEVSHEHGAVFSVPVNAKAGIFAEDVHGGRVLTDHLLAKVGNIPRCETRVLTADTAFVKELSAGMLNVETIDTAKVSCDNADFTSEDGHGVVLVDGVPAAMFGADGSVKTSTCIVNRVESTDTLTLADSEEGSRTLTDLCDKIPLSMMSGKGVLIFSAPQTPVWLAHPGKPGMVLVTDDSDLGFGWAEK